MTSAVSLTHSLSQSAWPVTRDPQVAYLLLEIMPTQSVAQVRVPLNLSLALDVSGSMDGEKIERLQEAVKLVIAMLGPGDAISIIAFNNRARTIVSARQPQSDRDKYTLMSQVDQLDAGGGTEIAPAINAALGELRRFATPQTMTRIVLLTDGQTEHEKKVIAEAQTAARMQVPILAFGIGSDWNEKLLLQIGQMTGGQADYIATPRELQDYFAATVTTMQSTVVQNAELTLRTVAGITPTRVWRVVPMIALLPAQAMSDRAVSVALGSMDKQQGQAVLVELSLPPRPPGNYRIAQAEVAYDVPLMRIVQEKVRADVMLAVTENVMQAPQVNARVMNTVEKVTAFTLQTQALSYAEAGNVAAATQLLSQASSIHERHGDADQARTVRLAANQLQGQAGISSETRKEIEFKGRKTVRLDQPPT